jgi:hypothetical protein
MAIPAMGKSLEKSWKIHGKMVLFEDVSMGTRWNKCL